MAEEIKKPAEKAPEAEKATETTKTTITSAMKKKIKRRSIVEANIYVFASYNNTIISIAEPNGEIVAQASSGSSGFKGARKSTPYAAQVAAENAVQKAKMYGIERAHVYVKGVGSGRESSLRGISLSQVDILSITDTTTIPHNGCRKRKARRV